MIPPCNICRQCNRKGRPSVSRGSAYCDSHKTHGKKINRSGLFTRVKDFIMSRRTVQVKTGKKDKDGKDITKEEFRTTKGFRPSWFWR